MFMIHDDSSLLEKHPFKIEIIRDEITLRESFKLRYAVYCEERGFEEGVNGEEYDKYDQHSRHALLRSTDDNVVLGTIRLILPQKNNLQKSFPIQELLPRELLRDIPQTGELSRMATSKKTRRQDINPIALRLSMYRAILQISHEEGLTQLIAVVRPAIIRLNSLAGIRSLSIGPLIEYHGLRQTITTEIRESLNNLRINRPLVWGYLSNNGEWFS